MHRSQRHCPLAFSDGLLERDLILLSYTIVLYYRDGRSFSPVWRTVVLSRVASLTAAGASDREFGLNTQRQLAAKLKETPVMIPIAAPIAG